MEHSILSIAERTDLAGKYVLVRASLNVPITDGKVANVFRLKQSVPTIAFLKKQGARVILCSHIGRKESDTLAPVYEALKEYFPLRFSPEVTGEVTLRMRNELNNGEVLLLENVRQDKREVENDAAFAQDLASLADVFVNDDFSTSHRKHASIHAICAYLPSYGGLGLLREYEELSKVMRPRSPALFMLGGAKFETKMPLIEKYLGIYDHLFIGGALANDFFKAKGYEVGKSLVSPISIKGSSLVDNPKILLPVDVIAVENGVVRIASPADVKENESILDAGPQTVQMLQEYISRARTILWNGPVGNYENGYQEQTRALARLVAHSDGYSVVGGGDTVAAIESLGCESHYGFLSTAGGAMLTFLEEGSLPALEVLRAART